MHLYAFVCTDIYMIFKKDVYAIFKGYESYNLVLKRRRDDKPLNASIFTGICALQNYPFYPRQIDAGFHHIDFLIWLVGYVCVCACVCVYAHTHLFVLEQVIVMQPRMASFLQYNLSWLCTHNFSTLSSQPCAYRCVPSWSVLFCCFPLGQTHISNVFGRVKHEEHSVIPSQNKGTCKTDSQASLYLSGCWCHEARCWQRARGAGSCPHCRLSERTSPGHL